MPLQTGSGNTLFTVQSGYFRKFGVEIFPVAGPPGTPAEAVAVHAPYAMRLVAWCAQAVGKVPDCPAFKTSDNEVLLADCVADPVKAVMPDGSEGWTVCGIYYYGLLQPPADGDPLPVPNSPFDSITGGQISPAQFLQGVLGFVTANAGGPWGGQGGGNFRGP